MGQFGSFKINERIEHFVYGTTELGPLEVGDFEPASLEEYEACQHLVSISAQPAGAAQSIAYAEETAPPAPVEPTAPVVTVPPEAPLPEAPLPEAPPASPAPPAIADVPVDTEPAAGDDVGKSS